MAETTGWEPYVDRSFEETAWLERIAAGKASPRSGMEARRALAVAPRLMRKHSLFAMGSPLVGLAMGLLITAAGGFPSWYVFAFPAAMSASLSAGSLWQRRLVEQNIPVLERLATSGTSPTS